MDQKLKISLIFVIIIVLGIGTYFLYNHFNLSSISITDMKYCTSADDCAPVDCGCSCSGCGGFSYDDIVNKKYVDAWYYQQGCKSAEICPMVCCSPKTIACEDNYCIVKDLPRE